MKNFYQTLMQFHENPSIIEGWHSILKPFLTWFSFEKRRLILAVVAIYFSIKLPIKYLSKASDQTGIIVDIATKSMTVGLLFFLVWLMYQFAAKLNKLPVFVKKHPLLLLHACYWGLLGIVWQLNAIGGRPYSILYAIALTFPFLIWRFGYLLQAGQQNKVVKTAFKDQFFVLWPPYGGTDTPFGKGLDFLSKSEAKDTESLAKSQLAGIKLIMLYWLWIGVSQLLNRFVFSSNASYSLGITRLPSLIEHGHQTPWLLSWLSLYAELIAQVLRHAINGLKIIAILRLFGFNVFRNTYKPLLAETVVEFWNRYYYYFKELMSSQFFMPTFMQLGKWLSNKPKLRLSLAVFAAAGLGNMYFHLIKQAENMANGHVLQTIYEMRSRFFYCFLLAIGIIFSMLREQNRQARPHSISQFAKSLRIAGVWTFFSLIFIWNANGGATFLQRTDFFLGLFGLNLSFFTF